MLRKLDSRINAVDALAAATLIPAFAYQIGNAVAMISESGLVITFTSLGGAILSFFGLMNLAYGIWLRTFASAGSRFMFSVNDTESPILRYTRHHYLGFALRPNYRLGPNLHNSLGFRGPELRSDGKKRFRIACLGGSTTYTYGIEDWRLSYPNQLESILIERGFDVEVLNAGGPGWSSHETLINFQFRVLDQKPDMIVIVHGINDVLSRFVMPQSHFPDNRGARMSPAKLSEITFWHFFPWIRCMRVRNGYRPPHTIYTASVVFEPGALQPEFERYYISGHVGSDRTAIDFKSIFKTNTIDYVERNFRSLISIARDNGVEVMLTSFPYTTEFPDHALTASAEFQAAYEEHNGMAARLAKDKNIYYCDLKSEMSESTEFWIDGYHVNEKGAKSKAAAVADSIQNTGFLDAYRTGL